MLILPDCIFFVSAGHPYIKGQKVEICRGDRSTVDVEVIDDKCGGDQDSTLLILGGGRSTIDVEVIDVEVIDTVDPWGGGSMVNVEAINDQHRGD